MESKSNTKGFTLVELLVVMAVIVILITIAIPIFTGLSEKAEIVIQDANIRAVKAIAVKEILSDPEYYYGELPDPDDPTAIRGWFLMAYIDEEGTISFPWGGVTMISYTEFTNFYINGIGGDPNARVVSDRVVVYKFKDSALKKMVTAVYLYLSPIDLEITSGG